MTPSSSHPGIPLIAHAARRARMAQLLLEGSLFTLAAVFVVISAVGAKRNQFGPPLAAVEKTGSAEVFAPSQSGAAPREAVSLIAASSHAPSDLFEVDAEPEPEPTAPETPSQPKFGIGTFVPESGAPRYFDGRPLRVKKTIWMTVTGYSPDARSCGDSADGRTATNHSVWTNAMQLVAADPRLLKYGSMVSVPGYANGDVVPVLDCGGAIKGNRLDLLYASHGEALRWGVKRVKVTVWEYADNRD